MVSRSAHSFNSLDVSTVEKLGNGRNRTYVYDNSSGSSFAVVSRSAHSFDSLGVSTVEK